MRKVLTACVLTLVLVATAAAQTPVSGVVRDETGAVVSGASILVRGERGLEQRAVTGPEGRFTLERGATGQPRIVVRAVGFAEAEQAIPASGTMDIVLQIASHAETVTVTPTRTEQRLGDVPASINVIDKETIRQSPAVVADDVLRQIPTFSLFRRTSSLSAHPTAQGVSLRGIGPSGVSRSLVLIDGVPFNDPFGGWVYWTRVPLESVDRIEVVDGASSSVYGNYAMGGVINVVSSRPRPQTFELRTQFGNRASRKADFVASDVWGRLGASLEGSFFRTDGFPQVVAAERGIVDTKAAVDYDNVSVKADYGLGDRVNLFARGGYFREERDNAKVTTVPAGAPGRPEANDTAWRSFSGGVRAALPDQSDLQARIFLDWNDFNSNFMAVPAATPARSIARMTLLQHVPTTGVGAIAQWAKALSARAMFSAGTDFRRVDGESQEQVLDGTTGTNVVTRRTTGGTQTSSGTFAQVQFWAVPEFSITLSGRVDYWRNFDAVHNEFSAATGLPTANHRGALPEKTDTVFSPRLGLLYHAANRVTVWGSIGSGFRAPSLNELYRQFSVGAVVTRANAELDPERLLGGEIGVSLAPIENLSVRTTWFDNRMRDPIANVTIGTNLQQRRNLGRTRVRGFQTDVDYRMGDWRAGAGYVFNRARVTEFVQPVATQPNIAGNFLAQVPKNRGTVSFAYSNPRYLTASVSAIVVGDQFDNDINTLVLPAYGTVELSLLRQVGRNLDVFFTGQNLFDKEYLVQRNPSTIGSPRLITGGLRVRWSGQ